MEVARQIVRRLTCALILGSLAACAAPPAGAPEALGREQLLRRLPSVLADETFAESELAALKARDVLALSPAMEDLVRRTLEPMAARVGGPEALYAVLYERGRIGVEYSSDYTRNAAEAFEARKGNCLSLALMTASFAKRLGIRVHYQLVRTPEAWSRGDRLNFQIRHVNVTLAQNAVDGFLRGSPFSQGLTVDFVPIEFKNRLALRELDESAVIAMYLNNLASESLDNAQYDRAYRLARQALLTDPTLPESYNTLAVVLSSRNQQAKAEAALRLSLALAPDSVAAMGNLIAILDETRNPEAGMWRNRLRELQPHPPFADFDQGLAALAAGDASKALALFLRQRERTGLDPRLQQYIAASYQRLGRSDDALAALQQGLQASDNEQQRQQLLAKKRALMQAVLKAD